MKHHKTTSHYKEVHIHCGGHANIYIGFGSGAWFSEIFSEKYYLEPRFVGLLGSWHLKYQVCLMFVLLWVPYCLARIQALSLLPQESGACDAFHFEGWIRVAWDQLVGSLRCLFSAPQLLFAVSSLLGIHFLTPSHKILTVGYHENLYCFKVTF